jgi:hypothetical protein
MLCNQCCSSKFKQLINSVLWSGFLEGTRVSSFSWLLTVSGFSVSVKSLVPYYQGQLHIYFRLPEIVSIERFSVLMKILLTDIFV